MNLKNLLAQLAFLEASLDKFSYQKLNTQEARALKNSFEAFRNLLEEKIRLETIRGADTGKIIFFSYPQGKRAENDVHETANAAGTNSVPSNDPGGSADFLKENGISNEQLGYINFILTVSGISSHLSADSEESEQLYQNIPKKPYLTKPMDKSHKIVSESGASEQSGTRESVKIDLGSVLRDCLGETDLLEELVRLFKQNSLEFIGQVKLHLQNLDYEGIRFASHKIKSGLRMMKTHELLAIAEQIEAESKTGRDVKHLNFLFDCFVKEYPGIEKAIDLELGNLK